MTAKAKKRSAMNPPSGQNTLAKPGFFDKYGVYVYLALAFLIPFLLMFFAFKVAGVSPFGSKQILVTDLWHQYYPFFVDFHDKLQHGGSLLWTWKSGGGTNYIALMAYYLASPLNFLSILVPADSLREFLYIITCVKIGLAGFFYALFLKITFKRTDMTITAFGIMYALCSFIMGYYWNIIWLDTIALLPLVITGTFALLRHGRFKLYIISLALSILANYYIGLFTCAFILLVSIGYCIVEYKGVKDILRQFVKMAVCSVISIMMTAVMVLPTYFALGYAYASDNHFPSAFAINIGSPADLSGVLQAIGKIIANSVAFTEPTSKEGLPNIYSGVIFIFLAILFMFCSKIKKRERIFCGGLLIFFILSFIIRQLDFIWHGFHFPNMLPHRFAFLYSFVLIYMAFRVFMNIDSIRLSNVISAVLAFLVYLGIAAGSVGDESVKTTPVFESSANVDPVLLSGFIGGIIAAWVLLYSLRERIPRIAMIIGSSAIGIACAVIVFTSGDLLNSAMGLSADNGFYIFIAVIILLLTVAAGLVVSSKEMNPDHRMTKVILSSVLLILAVTEGLFSAAAGVKSVSVTDSTSYPLGTYNTLNCVDQINLLEKDNQDLFHAEVNKYHTLNDNALIGINGISMFNSMVNQTTTSYMEKFGICGWVASNRFTYQEGSPFTNLMLNIKYLITPYGAYLDSTHNEQIYSSENVKLLHNKYYLPNGFMVNKQLMSYTYESAPSNPMDNQNAMFRMATGLEGNIYEYIEDSSISAGNSTSSITRSGNSGIYNYSASGNDTYDVNYVAPRDGVAMAYFTSNNNTDSMSIRVNGSERIGYYIKRPFIMMIGNVNAGDEISLHTTINNSNSGTITSYCAMFNDELFEQGYNKLALSTLSPTKRTDTYYAGTINVKEDGLFYTSISYNAGWRAYVDGEEVEITPVGKSELAFPLSAGSHKIELKYLPEGFIAGLSVSIFALLLFIGLIFTAKYKEKLYAKVPVLGRIAAFATSERKRPAEDDRNTAEVLDDIGETVDSADEAGKEETASDENGSDTTDEASESVPDETAEDVPDTGSESLENESPDTEPDEPDQA